MTVPSPSHKLRIIVGGLVGQFPLGGVAWDYFHYLLGLHALGHEVYYYEDTWVWPYDPIKRYPVDEPTYTVKYLGDFFATYCPDLVDRWHYLFLHDKAFGMSKQSFAEVARTADVFLNVSGACFIPEELSPRCRKVFLDTDPGYNQIMLHEKHAWSQNIERWCEQVAAHDVHLTYAENIYAPDCVLPRMHFDWRPTRPIVTLPHWSWIKDRPAPREAPFTTVMSWTYYAGDLTYNGVKYDTKISEFMRFKDLPHRTAAPILMAIGGHATPYEKIKAWGWNYIDAREMSLTPLSYQQFIVDSLAEWSIAKNFYVATNSGWFSCRTACYLAGARPAVVQDTTWSRYVPAGRGVLAFNTMDQTLAAIDDVRTNYAAHCAAAYEIAREYLAPDRVLPPMLEAVYASSQATAPRPPSLT